jgi:hypothetical protein
MIADSVPPTEAKHNLVHRVETVGRQQKKRDLGPFLGIFGARWQSRQNGAKSYNLTSLVQLSVWHLSSPHFGAKANNVKYVG